MRTEASGHSEAAGLLRFWFEELTPRQWFRGSAELDRRISERYGDLSASAQGGALAPWARQPETALALVLLLDQFPRQIWRGQARAFAGDPQAQALAQDALAAGWIEAEADINRRRFWLMPLCTASH